MIPLILFALSHKVSGLPCAYMLFGLHSLLASLTMNFTVFESSFISNMPQSIQPTFTKMEENKN